LPVLKAELAQQELIGLDRLREFGTTVYGNADAAAVLFDGEPLRIEKRNGHHVLALQLPFADKDDLELGRRNDELLVRVGPYRRALVLPDSLKRRQVEGATMTGDWLEVTFTGNGHGNGNHKAGSAGTGKKKS